MTDEQLTALAERFCAAPLPHSVCADLVAIKQMDGRFGTNLMTVAEAKEVLRFVLGETTPVSDPSREVLTAFADSLDAVPFDTASAAFFSFDTTHGHARVLRRAIRELLDRVDTIRPPYKPFWENPDGPGAA